MKSEDRRKRRIGSRPDGDAEVERDADSMLPVTRDGRAACSDDDLSPELARAEELRRIATSPSIQALWSAVLPLVGVLPARAGEFPGMFKVEPIPGKKDEATIYIDIPSRPYERGVGSKMDRVLALNVRLDHDYRRLGDRHYCVDCEVSGSETRH